MAERLVIHAGVECRSSEDGPQLHLVAVQEGRAAGETRRELFTPGSISWPATGVAVRAEHRGAEHGRAVPERAENGEIRLSVPARPPLFAAFQAGKRFASVEFFALEERTTKTGIREVTRALVDGVALTDQPEYEQGRVEIRARAPRWVYL